MDYLQEQTQCNSVVLDQKETKNQNQNIQIPQLLLKESDKLSIDTNSSANSSTMYSNKGSRSDSRSDRNFMFLIKTFETKYPQDVNKKCWSKSSTPRSKNSNENRKCKMEFNEIEELRDEDFFDVQKKQTIPKLKMIRDDLEFKSSCGNIQTSSMKFNDKKSNLSQSSIQEDQFHQFQRYRCRSLEPLEEDIQNEDELKTKHKFPTMVDKNEFNMKLKKFFEKQYQNNTNERRYSIIMNNPNITSIQEENENEIKETLNESFEKKSANDSCSSFPIYKWKKIDELDDININNKKKKNTVLMVLEGDDSVVIQEDLKGEEKIEEDLGIFKIVKEKMQLMQDEKKFLKKLIKGEQLTEEDSIRLNLEKDYSQLQASEIIAEEEDNQNGNGNGNGSSPSSQSKNQIQTIEESQEIQES